MALPPGVDVVSLTDFVSLARDLADRAGAPRRLKGRTRYVYERDVRLGGAPGQVQADAERYFPGVARGGEEGGVERVARYARDFFRRDKMTAICAEMKALQDDLVAEATLMGNKQLEKMIGNIQEDQSILKCDNKTRARNLRECAHICLKGIPSDVRTRPIYARTEEGAPPTPVWGVSPPNCRIDAKSAAGSERLAVLRATAIALATAHREDWPHRRLSVYQIVVVSKQHGREGTGQSSTSLESVGSECIPGLTKVLQFYSDRTGCHGVGDSANKCRRCAILLAEKRAEIGFDLFESERKDGNNALFLDDQNAALDDGKRHDVRSFARLLLWIYSGTFLPDTRPLKIDFVREEAGEGEEEETRREALREINTALSCVPWPLRFILFESERLSMDNIALFLDALVGSKSSEPMATPHDSNYLQPPQEGGDASSEESLNVYQALRDLCMRSAEVGMWTDEPEAAMHMGRFWENIAKKPEAEGRETALGNATRCYSLAFELGEQDGMLKLAKLKCDRAQGMKAIKRRSVELRAMLQALLKAGAVGNIEARAALHVFAEFGVEKTAAFLDKDQPLPHQKSYEYDNDFSFVRAITKIGKLHRRGKAAQRWRIQPDLDEARHWLEIASHRAHPEAILELGLLGVQQAESIDKVRESVDLVKKAANAQLCPNACFWLSLWYKNPKFLCCALEENRDAAKQPLPDNAVLEEDPGKAVSYALLGVKADHSDSIDLYLNMIREGYPSRTYAASVDEKTSRDLNNRMWRSAKKVDGKYRCRASFSRARHMLAQVEHAAEQPRDNATVSSSSQSESWLPRVGRRSAERARTANAVSPTGQELGGLLTRAEIYDLFVHAIEIMVDDRCSHLQREQEQPTLGPPPLDPLPLLVAATEIFKSRKLLTECKFACQSTKRQGGDSTEHEKEKEAFQAGLRKLVRDLCQRASDCYRDPLYHEVRVDWLAWDRKWRGNLESLLEMCPP